MEKTDLSVYLIADPDHTNGRPLPDVVSAALAGGASIVQLRTKGLPDRDVLNLARELRGLTRERNISLIINDRVDIAVAVDADGVHVGPDDLPVPVVRALMAKGKLVGASAPSIDEARRAAAAGADYLGIGAIYNAHGAKPDASEPRGPAWIRKVVQAVNVPVVGIGGIRLDNAAAVTEAGAAGVAVIRAICSADDPKAATAELKRQVEAGKRASRGPGAHPG